MPPPTIMLHKQNLDNICTNAHNKSAHALAKTLVLKVLTRAQMNPKKTTQGLGLKEDWDSVYMD